MRDAWPQEALGRDRPSATSALLGDVQSHQCALQGRLGHRKVCELFFLFESFLRSATCFFSTACGI